MPFEKGKRHPKAAPLWKPGQSGNPGGKVKGIQPKHNEAVKMVVAMLERVMAEPDIMESVETQFRKAITTNAPKAIREYLIPFLPTVTASTTQDETGKIVHRLSVSQLKQLAAAAPDDNQNCESSEAIDV